MEVGAVKQAFNNEIILLKKNLNQAKIQTIHKLTRKAKTLTEKKAPDNLKEKLKRKAESAVKEVLIIKKIKARDIARFIVTHTGKLNDYLNKPMVDDDKACARLLLHKAMQEKYKLIRDKFSNISIKDLFMSRQERLKLKKEAKEKQKNKKKGKSQAVNVQGEWDVEMTDSSKEKITPNDTNVEEDDMNDEDLSDDNDNFNNDIISDDGIDDDDEDDEDVDSDVLSNTGLANDNNKSEFIQKDNNENNESNKESNKLLKLNNVNKSKTKEPVSSSNLKLNNSKQNKLLINDEKLLKIEVKKPEKKHKDNKNKNLNEKLQNRRFNKESDDVSEKVSKIVDPFFITSSGQNYLSLVEPRQPDEVKEVHKEGNRKHRRAVMFGHVPKIKPRKHFEANRFDNHNNYTNNSNDFSKKQQSNNKIKFDSQKSFNKEDTVAEKLHPSWEAKKKQSGIVPFKGKKIVFDES